MDLTNLSERVMAISCGTDVDLMSFSSAMADPEFSRRQEDDRTDGELPGRMKASIPPPSRMPTGGLVVVVMATSEGGVEGEKQTSRT